MKEKINDSGKVNEPGVSYLATGNKRITFFSSLEEENEATSRYYASLSPEERLMHVNEMVKRIFANELREHPTLGNRIFFD